MISTGNDIIALKAIDRNRTREKKFWSKILSLSESNLYLHERFATLPYENFVWLLWSVKESVYKCMQRNNPKLLFSPRKIIIESINFPERDTITIFGKGEHEQTSFHEGECYHCTANVEEEIFYSRSKFYDELVYSVASNNEIFENILWGIKFIDQIDYENQSAEVRSFVLKKLNSFFPEDNLEIRKNAAGCPILMNGIKELNIPLSFSHHEQFIAYSFIGSLN